MLTREASPGLLDVLIADDDTPLRSDLRLLLEVHGYTCAEAANGREAVEVARRLRPQCLLLDLAMPGLDGFAVARTLRSDPLTRMIHIHCLTGCSDPAARQRAMAVGCEKYLTKPVAGTEILEVVRQDLQVAETVRVPGLNMSEGRDLLDWLERQGCSQLEARLQGDTFVVGCLCPPGLRLVLAADGEIQLCKR